MVLQPRFLFNPAKMSKPVQEGKRKRTDEEPAVKKTKVATEHQPQPQEKQTSPADKAEARRQAKALKKERKLQLPGAAILESVKPLWDECRQTTLTTEQRQEPLSKLFEAMRGHYVESLIKNDGSRVVQTIVKYGSKEQREFIIQELKGHFVELAKNAYGKHIIVKLMQSTPTGRAMIIGEFQNKLLSCLTHAHASSVVDTIYSDYSKVAQRNDMMHEFYGKQFTLFADYSGQSLEDILERCPEKKQQIVEKLRKAVDSVLSKELTKLVHHSVVHRLILDYVRHEEIGKLRSWMPTIVDSLMEIVHTEDGAKAVVLLTAIAGAKERKALLKASRPYLQKLVKDESAHLAVIAMSLFVDDTVLVEKTFLQELCKSASETIINRYSRQIVFALYGGVTLRHFSQDTVKLFTKAQQIAADTCKKPEVTRRQELCSTVSPCLFALFEPRLKESLKTPTHSNVLLEMCSSGFCNDILDKIMGLMTPTVLEEEAPRIFMKRLLKRSKEQHKLLDALEPIDQLLASDAGFILSAAVEVDQSVRDRLTKVITKLPSMTESARSLADLINRVNAGLPIHPQN